MLENGHFVCVHLQCVTMTCPVIEPIEGNQLLYREVPGSIEKYRVEFMNPQWGNQFLPGSVSMVSAAL